MWCILAVLSTGSLLTLKDTGPTGRVEAAATVVAPVQKEKQDRLEVHVDEVDARAIERLTQLAQLPPAPPEIIWDDDEEPRPKVPPTFAKVPKPSKPTAKPAKHHQHHHHHHKSKGQTWTPPPDQSPGSSTSVCISGCRSTSTSQTRP